MLVKKGLKKQTNHNYLTNFWNDGSDSCVIFSLDCVVYRAHRKSDAINKTNHLSININLT